MSSAQQQAKKIAWLESMLDTSIAAYEFHRNALENIYTQLAQWQQPPNTGCIHISPAEVNELLHDINDVLDQCALQLQPFDNTSGDADKQGSEVPTDAAAAAAMDGDGAEANTRHTPSSRGQNSAAAVARQVREQESDSRASSHRGVTNMPSLSSPTQDHPMQPEQQDPQQQRPPQPPQPQQQQQQNNSSPTPSGRSRLNQPRGAAGPVTAPADASSDRQEASARAASDAPPQKPSQVPHQRAPSATPSQASVASVPPRAGGAGGGLESEEADAPLTPAVEMSDIHSTQSRHLCPQPGDDNHENEDRVQGSTPAPVDSSLRSSVRHNNIRNNDRGNETPLNASDLRRMPPTATSNANAGTPPRGGNGGVEGASTDSGVPCVSPAQLDQTSQRAAPQRQPTDAASTRSATTQASSRIPPSSQRQPPVNREERQVHAPPSSSPPANAQLVSMPPASQVAEERPRPRMQTCYHHRRVAGLALTPWPILNNGQDDAAAVGGMLAPSAAARAAATHNELPAEQYSSYKDRGEVLRTSPERLAAAAALERRAVEVEEAKENAVYLPPDDDVAERAAAQARQQASTANQAPSSSSPALGLSASLDDSQRSRNQQQQQQPRGLAPCPQAGTASTTPSSAATAHEHRTGSRTPSNAPQQQQNVSHSQPSHNLADKAQNNPHSTNEERKGYDDGVNHQDPYKDETDSAVIPRRRGSSAAVETSSEVSSAVPSYVGERASRQGQSQRSASQRSHRSQPSYQQQQQQQQQRQAAAHGDGTPQGGSRTPSRVGGALRSGSAKSGADSRDSVTSTPHRQQQQQQQPPTVASASHASSVAGPRSGSAHQDPAAPSSTSSQHDQTSKNNSINANGGAMAAPSVKRQLNINGTPQMEASQIGSVGLVQTPSATPYHSTTHDFFQQQRQQHSQAASTEAVPPPPQIPGAHRPLRTAVPRRTTPRAYDSTQSEDAIFHGRLRGSPGRPPVRTDSPNALRYMDREDSQLRQRREEELAEIQNDPRAALTQQQQLQIGGPKGLLRVAESSAEEAGCYANGVIIVPGKNGRAEKMKMTAVEEQLVAERTALHNQLEKLQMEVTIATARNKEWGNERRYAQANARMSRVLEDLDRVEKELRTVRNIDREARSESMPKTQ